MFRTVKIKSIGLTVFSLIGVLLFVAVCLISLRMGGADNTSVGGETYSLRAEDEEGIVDFLASCGYENPQLLFKHEITVPLHWNELYTDYNNLQRQQGLDLVPYKGKQATEYIFSAPDGHSLTVTVCEDRVIAAHLADCDGKQMQALIR